MIPPLAAMVFVSGMCALIYEITLVRVLGYAFGHTFYAVSTVLTTYMAGLALGSHVFGKVADRRPELGLRYYARLEGAIALYAIPVALWWEPVSKGVMRWIGTAIEPSFGLALGIKFAIGATLLMPLTFLMGATLPVLSRYATPRIEQLGQSLGSLYGWNTLGGVAGTALAGFAAIPTLGVRATMSLAIVGNLLVCVSASLFASRAGVASANTGDSRAQPQEAAEAGDSRSFAPEAMDTIRRVVPLVALLTGFASLGIEVVWTRVFSALLAPTPYVFTTILVGFLAGLGVGSLLTAQRFATLDRQKTITLAAGVLLVSGLVMLAIYPCLPFFARLLNRINDPDSVGAGAWVRWAARRFTIVFGPVFFATTVFGMALPLLMRARIGQLTWMGRSVGDVYAVNTVGAIFGSFGAGFALLPYLGSNATSLLLASLVLLSAVILFAAQGARRTAAAVALVSLAACGIAARTPLYHYGSYFGDVAVVQPITQQPFESALGTQAKVVFNREDPTSLATVLEVASGHRILLVDGIITASDSEIVFWNLALKGHLPLLWHAAPKDVLVIGLGAGITVGAMAQHDLDSITVVELSRSVIEAQPLFRSANLGAYQQSNVRLVENDGRDFLLQTADQYDVITIDQTDPPVMMLYSADFYRDARRKLRPDGILVQWVPLYHMSTPSLLSIVKAFREVFPSVSVWSGRECVFLMGTNGTLAIDPDQVAKRLANPRVRASLARFGADDAATLYSLYLAGDAEVDHLLARNYADGRATSDDLPIVEFSVPKERFAHAAGAMRQLFSDEIGDVRALMKGQRGRDDTDPFLAIDFAKVAKTLFWLDDRRRSEVLARRPNAADWGLNERELAILTRYAGSKPVVTVDAPAP